MASREQYQENAPPQPGLKQSIKQKIGEVRRFSPLGQGWQVVVMSEGTHRGPEPHHFEISNSQAKKLADKLGFDSPSKIEQHLPKDKSGQPCEETDVYVWLAHVMPGTFGWRLSEVEHDRGKDNE